VRSKAGISQLNLAHGNNNKKVENLKVKTVKLRSIDQQLGESVESVRKKKRKEEFAEKEDFKPGVKK